MNYEVDNDMTNDMTNVAAQVRRLVLHAVDRVNEELPPESRIEKELGGPLAGSDSTIGSLGLINFVLMVEEEVTSIFGVEILLTESEAIFLDEGPLNTLGEFVQFFIEKIGDTDVGNQA